MNAAMNADGTEHPDLDMIRCNQFESYRSLVCERTLDARLFSLLAFCFSRMHRSRVIASRASRKERLNYERQLKARVRDVVSNEERVISPWASNQPFASSYNSIVSLITRAPCLVELMLRFLVPFAAALRFVGGNVLGQRKSNYRLR